MVLEASCPRCAVVTGKIEQSILRGELRTPRAAMRLFTRRPKERPASIPLEIEEDGQALSVNVPPEMHMAPLTLLTFEQPSYLTGADASPGTKVTGHFTLYPNASNLPLPRQKQSQILQRRSVTYRTSVVLKPHEFCRMLAKIAFAYVVGMYGSSKLSECYVLDLILGADEDSNRFVGAALHDLILTAGCLINGRHRILDFRRNGDIIVFLQLFSTSGNGSNNPPIYTVVVGKENEGNDE